MLPSAALWLCSVAKTSCMQHQRVLYMVTLSIGVCAHQLTPHNETLLTRPETTVNHVEPTLLWSHGQLVCVCGQKVAYNTDCAVYD